MASNLPAESGESSKALLAFVFPGQGSQYCGMGADLVGEFPPARRAFQEVDDALGFSLSRLCFEGPESELRLTENTQPAVLSTSVAVWRVLEERGVRPDFVAGHSLGEYSALVAAGAISLSDAVRVVRLRGQLMQSAVPAGEGAMAAILGMDLAGVEAVCQEAAHNEVVSAANINSPSQIVVSGHAAAVARASQLALQRGARRALPLAVSAPFHSVLMQPAQAPLAEALEGLTFGDLRVPLVNNVDARIVRSGDEARRGLIRQVTAPVRWTDCVEVLRRREVTRFLEVGPGRALTGLIRAIDRSLTSDPVGTRGELAGYV